MRVLIVGGGAREHALGQTLAIAGAEIYAFAPHENPGLSALARGFELGPPEDPEKVVAFARRRRIGLAVIGPESPLAAGVSDALRAAEVPVFGPSRAAAQIESSKRFCRELLARHHVDAGPKWAVLERPEAAEEAIRSIGGPCVLKPIALTSGKGVAVQGPDFPGPEEGAALARRLLASPAGRDGLLVEERLEGEEFSLMAFVADGAVVPMPAVQDYKRALEGDTGPNTGGMGSYSQRDHLLPFLSAAHRDRALEVVRAVAEALRADGTPFRGVLYGGFMLTAQGPKLLEFNARFGDPEAMNVLSLYEPGQFQDLLYAIATGELPSDLVRFRLRATVAKYIVPVGYGAAPEVGSVVEYDAPAIEDAGVHLYFGSVEPAGAGKVRFTSSRGLALVGEASAVWEASERVDAAAKFVRGRFYLRHDIGTREDLSRRVEHLRQLLAPGAKASPLPLSVAPPGAPPSSAAGPGQVLS
jgi:phosphoribosylamine--glycine ligase